MDSQVKTLPAADKNAFRELPRSMSNGGRPFPRIDAFEVDGMRADLVVARAATAHAAWRRRSVSRLMVTQTTRTGDPIEGNPHADPPIVRRGSACASARRASARRACGTASAAGS